tara:strand:- start:74 stop:214 length:141 start_codon:yes stop_codon:yes gene_type:complete
MSADSPLRFARATENKRQVRDKTEKNLLRGNVREDIFMIIIVELQI